MKKNISFLVVLILIFSMITTLVINFSNVKKFGNSEKIEVIATLFPQYDFAKQIGGDKVNVTLLLPPGTESHTYEPTPQDMIQINDSDLFIYTGKEMEPWASYLISGIRENINVLDLSTTVKLINTEEFEEEHLEHNIHEHEEMEHTDDDNDEYEQKEEQDNNNSSQHKHIERLEHSDEKENEHETNEEKHEHNSNAEEHQHNSLEDGHHHEYDPHIWLNPQYAIQMIKSIEQQLSKIDSKNSEYYKNNADNYIKKIQQLDSEFEEVVNNSTNPKVAFGGAFAYAYFIERYKLDFVSAYETCGENSEPSTTQIKEVIDYINNNKLPVIFYKEYTTGNIAKTISDETGAKMLVFNTVHNISKQEIDNGATYVSIMRENLENLKQALM